MKNVFCFCCKQDSKTLYDGNVGSFLKASNYIPLMDVSNGLEIRFVCSDCQELMVPHIKAILNMIPQDKWKYMHWGSFVQMVAEHDKRKQDVEKQV